MANDLSSLMREVLASPLGDVIASVGEGVAAAQEALDEASVAKTLELYSEGGDEMIALMREIGYQPTFYTLPETTGEVVVSMRLGNQNRTHQQAASRSRGAVLKRTRSAAHIPTALQGRRTLPVRSYVTPVDASFSNRYGFSASASTRLHFKIVPVPPPEGMDRARVMPALATKDVATATLVLETLDLEPAYFDKSGDPIAEPKDDAEIVRTVPEGGGIAIAGEQVLVFLK